jgi:type I restriction enzyme M protein
LLIKCDLVLQEEMALECADSSELSKGATGRADQSADRSAHSKFAPAKLYGQENEPGTWAMANMNMIIHDMEGEIQIG